MKNFTGLFKGHLKAAGLNGKIVRQPWDHIAGGSFKASLAQPHSIASPGTNPGTEPCKGFSYRDEVCQRTSIVTELQRAYDSVSELTGKLQDANQIIQELNEDLALADEHNRKAIEKRDILMDKAKQRHLAKLREQQQAHGKEVTRLRSTIDSLDVEKGDLFTLVKQQITLIGEQSKRLEAQQTTILNQQRDIEELKRIQQVLRQEVTAQHEQIIRFTNQGVVALGSGQVADTHDNHQIQGMDMGMRTPTAKQTFVETVISQVTEKAAGESDDSSEGLVAAASDDILSTLSSPAQNPKPPSDGSPAEQPGLATNASRPRTADEEFVSFHGEWAVAANKVEGDGFELQMLGTDSWACQVVIGLGYSVDSVAHGTYLFQKLVRIRSLLNIKLAVHNSNSMNRQLAIEVGFLADVPAEQFQMKHLEEHAWVWLACIYLADVHNGSRYTMDSHSKLIKALPQLLAKDVQTEVDHFGRLVSFQESGKRHVHFAADLNAIIKALDYRTALPLNDEFVNDDPLKPFNQIFAAAGAEPQYLYSNAVIDMRTGDMDPEAAANALGSLLDDIE